MGPLEGIRVIELASWVAVPTAGAILGDWGASVVKVENIKGGDPARGFRRAENVEVTDINFWWELCNRNKRSIAIDINKEEGRTILNKLVEHSDVFLTNLGLDSLKRRKLDYESLIKLNSKIIYASFTGYGEVGPDKNKPGFDITAFWTKGGFMYRLGEPGRTPPIQPIAPGDQISSMYIAGAVSTALFAREKTGRGQKVALSLYQNAVWSLGWEVQAALSTGNEVRWRYQNKVLNPLWNIYKTKDERWIQLAFLQSDQYWDSFCVAIGKEELKEDPRFKSHQKREENNEALIGLITEAFSKKTLEEWERTLSQYKMPCESARSIKEIVSDPQAIENGFFYEVKHPTSKDLKLVNSPVKFSETPAEIRMTAPELGQHTEEILLDLNYTWEAISHLKERAVISSCDPRHQRKNYD